MIGIKAWYKEEIRMIEILQWKIRTIGLKCSGRLGLGSVRVRKINSFIYPYIPMHKVELMQVLNAQEYLFQHSSDRSFGVPIRGNEQLQDFATM